MPGDIFGGFKIITLILHNKVIIKAVVRIKPCQMPFTEEFKMKTALKHFHAGFTNHYSGSSFDWDPCETKLLE